MNKLDMESKSITKDNVEYIREKFPNVVVESDKGYEIDFDLLKQELSNIIVDDKKEKYQLTWPGKSKSIYESNRMITSTLRPLKEKSVDFDNTKNIYIEGDNLDVLKILQESYLNKINVIYIDPPYNTGNDFIYNDSFNHTKNEELLQSGEIDEIGNRLISNNSSNGKFHSDWLSMMYSRLKLARNLLSKDGTIFISIGDDEQANLKKMCDEIFGERNFVSCICHKARASMSNDRIISENHNYLLFYCKDIDVVFNNRALIGDDPDLTGFNYEDEKGKYKLTPVDGPGGAKKGNPYYEFLGVTGYWRYSKETMQKKYDEGLIVKTQTSLQQKYYLEQAQASRKTVNSWWDDDFLTSTATKKLSDLLGGKYFDNPKNVNLVFRTLNMMTKFNKNAIVLDFFSGSATTAEAVLKMNTVDNGDRKFILVQLPEKCDEKSEAYKNGYRTICDIGEERIRRAAKKIEEETGANIDYGFRVYRVDSSNMKDVYYKPSEVAQTNLFDMIINIKEDRTPEDLLTQVMLDLGLTLDLKIVEKNILSNKVYYVADNSLVACFDDKVDINIIDEICKCNPMKVVFRDSSFKNDKDKINLEERVKKISPDTEINIL